jgi:hypothetical protein
LAISGGAVSAMAKKAEKTKRLIPFLALILVLMAGAVYGYASALWKSHAWPGRVQHVDAVPK